MAECPSHREDTACDSKCEGLFGGALGSPAAHARLWLVAVIGLAADLWSKHWAFTRLDPDGGTVIIEHLARFQRSLNTGALFGLGKGWTPVFIVASVLALVFVIYLFAQSGRDRRSLQVALGLVLAGALGNLYDRAFEIADVVKYVDRRGVERIEAGVLVPSQSNERFVVLGSYPEGSRLTRIERATVLRMWQQGVVRDFIKMEPRVPLGNGRWFDVWPWVYNIADVLLVVGVAILMLNFWKERRVAHAAQPGIAVVSATGDSNREQ